MVLQKVPGWEVSRMAYQDKFAKGLARTVKMYVDTKKPVMKKKR